MKKGKNLSHVLYVFVILSLMYTCYVLFSTYSTFSNYVAMGQADTTQLILALVSYSFTPVILTVILYALANISEMLTKLMPVESAIEEISNEVIDTIEVIDKTEDAK